MNTRKNANKKVPELQLKPTTNPSSFPPNPSFKSSPKTSRPNIKSIHLNNSESTFLEDPLYSHSFNASNNLSSRKTFSSAYRTSSVSFSLHSPKKSSNQLTTKNCNVFPDWLIERPDFLKCSTRRKSITDVGSIVSIYPSQFRTDFEKDLLFKWVNRTRFFSNVPNSITREVCDTLTRQDFFLDDFIIHKGDLGDCCFLLYSGNAGVHLEKGVLNSVLEPGEVIGEHALDTDKPRSADVTALTPCITFKLKKQDYISILINVKKLEKYSITKLLMNIPFFSSWSFLKNENLSNYLIRKSYPANEVLYDQGHESDTFFIIQAGEVLVEAYVDLYTKNLWPTGSANWKVRQVHKKCLTSVMTLTSGMFFGEFGLVNRVPRNERVSCLTNVVCLVINVGEFFDVFSEKDAEELVKKRYVRIPEKKDLERKMMSELRARKEKEKALFQSIEVDYSNPEGREWLMDNRTRRLRKWIIGKKLEKNEEEMELKKKVVGTRRTFFELGSLSKLREYHESSS